MGDQEAALGERDRVEALAGQICARATQQAQATCRLVELIGEFDAVGGLGYLRGVKSVAHWLSYSCSMSPGVAREHVRVARALRQMPTITEAFRSGELSYSKVREATRLVGVVDEARLCDLARSASASQLARMITGFRAGLGSRLQQQEDRRFGLVNRAENQMTGVSGKLPAEEAGVVAAALQAARDRHQTVPPAPSDDQPSGDDRSQDLDQSHDDDTDNAGQATPAYTDADALLDICQHYLNTAAGEDESGEDRHLVVVEVAAEQLASKPADQVARVSAGTQLAGENGADTSLIGDSGAVQRGSADDRIAPGVQRAAEAGGEGHDADVDDCQLVDDRPCGVPEGTPQRPTGRPRPESGKGPGSLTSPAPARRTAVIDGERAETVSDPGPGDGSARGSLAGSADERPCSLAAVGSGTWSLRSQVCSVRGVGGIEPATAARLVCTGSLLGAVVDAHGDVLALGRSRRLVSKTQRRALMIRDRMCQFPGCAQTRHLDAHHVTPWSQGGRTDLEGLILLCRFHHTSVHEGGIRICRSRDDGNNDQESPSTHTERPCWIFTLPDGEVLAATGGQVRTAHQLMRKLTEDHPPDVDHVSGLNHPDSKTIRPDQTGERFDLHACVQALFQMTPAETAQAA